MYKMMTKHSSTMVSSLQPQVQNGEVIRIKEWVYGEWEYAGILIKMEIMKSYLKCTIYQMMVRRHNVDIVHVDAK